MTRTHKSVTAYSSSLDSSIEKNAARKEIGVLVVGSYGIKVVVKSIVGFIGNSPPLIADAAHGVVDIGEYFIIQWAGIHARKPDLEKYPVGRVALINMIAIAIYVGVLVAALWAIKLGLSTVLVNFGVHDHEYFPVFLRDYVTSSAFEAPTYLWLPAIVMLLSSSSSFLISRKEKKLAVQHGLTEFKADADELHNDGVLELIIAFGLFIQGVLLFLAELKGWGLDVILSISGVVTGVLFLCVGGYLFYHSIRECMINLRVILNPSIDTSKRVLLEQVLSERFPSTCKLVTPITAYLRGDDCIVKGLILIDRRMISASPMLTSRAQLITQAFLEPEFSGDVKAQFSHEVVDLPEEIQLDWNRLLIEVWNITKDSYLFKAFVFFKKGRMHELRECLDKHKSSSNDEIALKLWLKAEWALETSYPAGDLCREIVDSISCLETDEYPRTSLAMLSCWQLKRAVMVGQQSRECAEHLRAVMEYLENKETDLPLIVLAECAFIIGFYYQRVSDFDLDKSATFYVRSEELYARSGIQTEADRLNNTWGHQDTLLYNLVDGIIRLESSRCVKEIKGDLLGLSYTLGCLGDAYSRCGEYKRADDYYLQDLKLLGVTSSNVKFLHVLIKRTESKIRRGLAERNAAFLYEAIDLLRGINLQEKDIESSSFFVLKARTKALLGLVSIEANGVDRSKHIAAVACLITEMQPTVPYQKAFKERLLGRLSGQQGEIVLASQHLTKAECLFEPMSKDSSGKMVSVQAILCRLERNFWLSCGDTNKALSGVNGVEFSLAELNAYLLPLGGLLGGARELIDSYLNEYYSSDSEVSARTSIEQLIGFMEG